MHNTCCGGEAKGQRRDVGFSTIRNTPTPREDTSAPLRDTIHVPAESTTTAVRWPSYFHSTATPSPLEVTARNVANMGSGDPCRAPAA